MLIEEIREFCETCDLRCNRDWQELYDYFTNYRNIKSLQLVIRLGKLEIYIDRKELFEIKSVYNTYLFPYAYDPSRQTFVGIIAKYLNHFENLETYIINDSTQYCLTRIACDIGVKSNECYIDPPPLMTTLEISSWEDNNRLNAGFLRSVKNLTVQNLVLSDSFVDSLGFSCLHFENLTVRYDFQSSWANLIKFFEKISIDDFNIKMAKKVNIISAQAEIHQYIKDDSPEFREIIETYFTTKESLILYFGDVQRSMIEMFHEKTKENHCLVKPATKC